MDRLKEKELPKYEPPQVVTYTGVITYTMDEILAEPEPVHARYHNPEPVVQGGWLLSLLSSSKVRKGLGKFMVAPPLRRPR